MDSKKQQACRFKTTILIVMLNVNVISTPVKSWRYSECIEKADTKEKKKKQIQLIRCLQKRHFKLLNGHKSVKRQKMKGRKTHHENTNVSVLHLSLF